MEQSPTWVLITGGGGLIGSYKTQCLLEQNRKNKRDYRIVIADQKQSAGHGIPPPSDNSSGGITGSDAVIFHCCDLRDEASVVALFRKYPPFDVVMHLSANMGGMGFISPAAGNQTSMWLDNTPQTLHLVKHFLQQRKESGEKAGAVFVYASTACVYRDELQDGKNEVAAPKLREDDASVYPRAKSLGKAYEADKLFGEELLRQVQFESQAPGTAPDSTHYLSIRFHNVYGKGTWRTSKAKLPLATVRKALVVQEGKEVAPALPLWGDGTPKRSFLYAGDAAEAVCGLVENLLRPQELCGDGTTALREYCKNSGVINVGSDEELTVTQVAKTVLDAVGIPNAELQFDNDSTCRGVQSRNCDNSLLQSFLPHWKPMPFADGIKKVIPWMSQQLQQCTCCREDVLHGRGGDSQSGPVFGILLPLSSRGSQGQKDIFLRGIQQLAQSVKKTTSPEERLRLRIFVGVDFDDSEMKKWMPEVRRELHGVCCPCLEGHVHEYLLRHEDLSLPPTPRGAVCWYWAKLFQDAVSSGCDFIFLAGDDVTLETPGWMERIHGEFNAIHRERHTPYGFGVVSFEDTAFPGFPTFPVLHRSHLEAHGGTVFPSCFFNQDADPFVFQLYRRFGCARFLKGCQLHNGRGGAKDSDCRYTKKAAAGWSHDILDDAVSRLQRFLGPEVARQCMTTTLTVGIPSYRCLPEILENIVAAAKRPEAKLQMKNVSVDVIIVLDDPASRIPVDETDPWIRVRRNTSNLGASRTRNRILMESASDWVYFLDDDVVPHVECVAEVLRCIERHGRDACGFVGDTQLVVPRDGRGHRTAKQLAVHVAGVAFFWRVATIRPEKEPQVHWGITANLCVRRVRGVEFNAVFPRTGGGEDIDYCIKLQAATQKPLLKAPGVVVEHPYWNEGRVHVSRFSGWAKGDGLLHTLYPERTYRSHWNDMEMTFAVACVIGLFLILSLLAFPVSTAAAISPLSVVPCLCSGLVSAHCWAYMCELHFIYYHADDDLRFRLIDDHIQPTSIAREVRNSIFAVAFWSRCVCLSSEGGRLLGHFQHGELIDNIGVRFMWWGPQFVEIIRGEQHRFKSNTIHFAVALFVGTMAPLFTSWCM